MQHNQVYGSGFINRTPQEIFKDIIREITSFVYARPKKILSLLSHPSMVDGPTYFPEMRRKSKGRIILEQILNILRNESIEPYYYLYGLDVKDKVAEGGYTPYMRFLRRRNRLNFRSEHNASCILRNKLYFGAVAKSLGIPTPENIILTLGDDGKGVELSTGRIVPLITLLANLHGSFFCKPLDGECGLGVMKLSVSAGTHSGTLKNEELSLHEIAKRLSTTEFLIQKSITQHPAIQAIYPKSINTLRLTTVVDVNTGRIEAFPSALRIGNLGNTVDNFSLGGVIVNVNLASGKLERIGFMKSEYGTTAERHPYTGVAFKDVTVPFIHEAVIMARKFHSFLNIHSVGWDIAITENGPCFIEGNDNWEIDVQQNALHPLDSYFRKYFYKR